jgi:hypothetical protein
VVRRNDSMSTVHRTWKTFAYSLIASRPSNCQLPPDIVGLYPNPVQRRVVLCVDEKKARCKALERTHPLLAMHSKEI